MAFNWREHDDETIEYHFNPRLSVPDTLDLLKAQEEQASLARESMEGKLDIRYGQRPKETFDLHPAIGGKSGFLPPVLVFIHGGYWRMSDKSAVSHVAANIVKDGVTFISLNYDLCPDVTLDIIVEEIRHAMVYIFKNASDLNIDQNRIFISGHSAGGHLSGMMLKEDWVSNGLPENFIKGGFPLSPIFEPEVVIHTSINEDVRLDVEMARRNNVISEPPSTRAPIITAVGELEPEGWRQQSLSYVDICRANGVEAEYYEIPGCHHFNLLDTLFDKDHEFYGKMITMIKEAGRNQ